MNCTLYQYALANTLKPYFPLFHLLYYTIWTSKIAMHVTLFSDPCIQMMYKNLLFFYCYYQYLMVFKYKKTAFAVDIDNSFEKS